MVKSKSFKYIAILISLATTISLFIIFFSSNQTTYEKKIKIEEVSFGNLPNWNSDNLTQVWPAFIRSCEQLKTLHADTTLTNDQRVSEWHNVCSKAEAVSNSNEGEIRKFFEMEFLPYKISEGRKSEGLFTGFYEPEIKGSKIKSSQYNIPVYKKPSDLVIIDDLGIFKPELKGMRIAGSINGGELKPYLTRKEIEAKGLHGNEILWVDDIIDNFFMHIAGSAVVHLENGEKVRLKYAGTNGRRYKAIGKILVEMKEMTPESVSMQSIKNWLRAHPSLAKDIMDQNESFTFFEELQQEGPIGTQRVVLTPTRSLGVNPKYISFGTPIWLDVPHPDDSQSRIQRLVIAQDEDGTIKGAVGGNLFWGTGETAGDLAGKMKSIGKYYILLPKNLRVDMGSIFGHEL